MNAGIGGFSANAAASGPCILDAPNDVTQFRDGARFTSEIGSETKCQRSEREGPEM
jgi:hypothetical protein